jgi:integrase/recombinase XerD
METKTLAHTTSQIDFIPDWANFFYQAKKVEGISPCTLAFYRQQLGHFLRFCDAQVIENVSQITANNIREYLLWLGESGHNPGGVHAAYRVLKTFLRWYENEMEPEGWRNPVSKVKAPKLSEDPIDPVEVEEIRAMIETCRNSFLDKRDKAILLCLFDTGSRAREFLNIQLEDVNFITGAILIRQGKGRKPRSVFLGKQARKSLRIYIRARIDDNPSLWVSEAGLDLGYGGLRAILQKRARLAGIQAPTAHDFRRAFALECLRNGMDLITLARLMGHTNLKVLQRYLRQLPEDLQEAHRKASPVDQRL